MRNTIILVMVLVLLLGCLGTAAFASYSGYGLVSSSQPNARGGSTGGIFFIGGGPSSGK
jgi:hypothetical protein